MEGNCVYHIALDRFKLNFIVHGGPVLVDIATCTERTLHHEDVTACLERVHNSTKQNNIHGYIHGHIDGHFMSGSICVRDQCVCREVFVGSSASP